MSVSIPAGYIKVPALLNRNGPWEAAEIGRSRRDTRELESKQRHGRWPTDGNRLRRFRDKFIPTGNI